ncbi:MAG: chromate transporter [Bacillaceae bacterium]|nr:chromate transporter [Bacillaceae bacterium]
MAELLEIFLTFFKIGFVSFGGGIAMLPLIDYEVTQVHGWIAPQEFLDIIAVAGMSPGPAATNAAIVVGYAVAGFPGAVVATVGMVLPSLMIILIVAMFFFRIQEKPLVQSAFYGLRPVITGLIFYAATVFALRNEIIGGEKLINPLYLLILVSALLLMLFTRIHPVFIIIASGFVGVMLFG